MNNDLTYITVGHYSAKNYVEAIEYLYKNKCDYGINLFHVVTGGLLWEIIIFYGTSLYGSALIMGYEADFRLRYLVVNNGTLSSVKSIVFS